MIEAQGMHITTRFAVSTLALVLAPLAASAQDENKPIVIVNGEPIPRKTLAKILAPLEKARLPKEQVNEIARRHVRQLVKNVLLGQFMRGEGYLPSEEEMEAEIARLRGMYEESSPTGAPSFEEALRRKGTGLREMRATPTAGMRFSCYVRSKMTERDLLRLFETERHGFDGTEVRARHILIDPRRTGGKSGLARRDTARQMAVEIRTLALEAGAGPDDEEFGKLAREHSHCPSAAKGGDVGYFTRFGVMPFGVAVEEFARAAFEADIGEIPPVFETRFGFHAIRVTGRKPGRHVTLKEVRDKVADVWAKRRGLGIYDELCRRAKIERPE